MPLRNVPITYTIDQQRQEINSLASDVNDIDVNFDEKVDDRVAALLQGGIGTAVTYDDANGSMSIDLAFNEFSTSSILEGTNLYYTDARANLAIDARVNQNFVNNLNITNLGPQDSITLTLGQTTRTITPLNYNNTSWDTAYGWGDHSAQNYLTTYSESDTLDSVTGRGGITTHDVTVGSIKVNTITSKLSGDNLGITAGKVLFTNDVSVGTFSTGFANDYGINFDKNGELIINHSSTGGGLYLRSSGTNNFYVDKDGKINGAVKFVTADGTSGQSLQTDGNGNFSFTNNSIVSSNIPTSQEFTGDGTTVDYTLTDTPADEESIDVYVNDVLQRPSIYSLNGTTLTFNTTPASGDNIYVKYRYPNATNVSLVNNSVENQHLDLIYTSSQYVGDNTTTQYTIQTGHSVHSVLVIVDGLILQPTEYSISGATLTITNAPSTSSTVDFRYFPI